MMKKSTANLDNALIIHRDEESHLARFVDLNTAWIERIKGDVGIKFCKTGNSG